MNKKSTQFSFYKPSDYYFLDYYSSTSNCKKLLEEFKLIKISDSGLVISNGREILHIKGKNSLPLVREGRVYFFPLAHLATKRSIVSNFSYINSLLKKRVYSIKAHQRVSYRKKNLLLKFVFILNGSEGKLVKSLRKSKRKKSRLLSIKKRGNYLKFSENNEKLPRFLPLFASRQSNLSSKLYSFILSRGVSNLLRSCRQVGLIHSKHLLRYIYKGVKQRFLTRFFVSKYGVVFSKLHVFLRLNSFWLLDKHFESLNCYCLNAVETYKNFIPSKIVRGYRGHLSPVNLPKKRKKRTPYFLRGVKLARSRLFLLPTAPQKKLYRDLETFKNTCLSYCLLDRNNRRLNFFVIFRNFRLCVARSKKRLGGRFRKHRYGSVKKLAKIYYRRFQLVQDPHLKLLEVAYPRKLSLEQRRKKISVNKKKKIKKRYFNRRKKFIKNHATIR